MTRRIRASWRRWLAGVLLGTCAAGCKGLLGSQGPPGDPLFANHKPHETKAEQSAPVLIAFAEPEIPTDPITAVARAAQPKAAPVEIEAPRGTVPGILTNRPRPQTQAPAPETARPPQ
jgi:hypothetical protein